MRKEKSEGAVCPELFRSENSIHGGYGYAKDYPPEKYWRVSKLRTIGEGTSGIQRAVIARQLFEA